MAEAQRTDDERPGAGNPELRFGHFVGRKAVRKLRARREADRGGWFWLGMFGLVGWSVAVPTVIGIALGLWFDRHFPGRVSWTLTLLIVGVALGCLNAWYWIKQENRP
jgi:ATP synthase protein I